jgi:hypothetical protein
MGRAALKGCVDDELRCRRDAAKEVIMTTILDQIREGMTICDPAGNDIGTVDFVRLSDEDPATPGPEVVTADPLPRDTGNTLIGALADAFRTDDIPDTLRDRLLREGFIRVDVAGLFAADRYVMPDQIASVSGDKVTLAVDKESLMRT